VRNLVQVCSNLISLTMRKARNDPRNQDCEVASLSPQVLSFIQARCQALLFRRSRHRVVDTEKEPGDMATLSSQSFGDLLRRHRLAAGLTQEVLADRAGLSVRGLSDLERGARLAPRRETVQLLCKALQLSEAERARLEAVARHRGISAARAQGESLSLPPGNLHASPFVGRTPELALLDHLLRDNLPGLLVAGEPGIGKSRLLQVGIERAKAQGWTVLTGAAIDAAVRNHMPPWSMPWPTPCGASRQLSSRGTCRTAHGWCAYYPNWPKPG